jgi:hypothetical protein
MTAIFKADEIDRKDTNKVLPMVAALADSYSIMRSYMSDAHEAISDVLRTAAKIPRANDLLASWEALTPEQQANEAACDFRVWANLQQVCCRSSHLQVLLMI